MKKLLFAAFALCLSVSLAAAQFADQRQYVGTSGGSANAQTLAIPNYALNIGVVIRGRMSATNSGAATLNVNGTGAVPVRKVTTAGLAELSGAEIVNGQISEFIFDGSYFELLTTMPFLVYSTAAGNIAVGPNTFDPNNGQASNLYNTAFGVGALQNSTNQHRTSRCQWIFPLRHS